MNVLCPLCPHKVVVPEEEATHISTIQAEAPHTVSSQLLSTLGRSEEPMINDA